MLNKKMFVFRRNVRFVRNGGKNFYFSFFVFRISLYNILDIKNIVHLDILLTAADENLDMFEPYFFP